MKKRILALAMTVLMVCALVVSAGATLVPSVTVETAPTVSGATASDGTVIPSGDLAVTAVQDVNALPAEKAAQLRQAYQEINSAGSVSTFLRNAGLTSAVNAALSGTSVKSEDLDVHSMFDVSASGKAAEVLAANGSVDITFDVPGVKSGDSVVVLHQGKNGWDMRPSTAGNGTVKASFTELSPVVIMVGEAAPAASPASPVSPAAGNTATVTSPQTSDVNFEGVLLCGTLLCAVVMAYCLKRRQAA